MIKILTIHIGFWFQDTISFITSGIAVGLNLAINAYQFLDIAGLRDETRSNLAIINTNTEESRFIVFIPLLALNNCIFFGPVLYIFFIFLFSVTALKVNVQSLNSVTNTISTLASNNKKRLTNSDSALGNICTSLDRLYNSESPARDCCHVTHSSSEVGNFMYCLTRTAASTIGFGNVGTGSCATTCSGLAPE